MKLVITDIKNINQKADENSKTVKIDVDKKNFNLINKSEVVIIKQESHQGEFKLKHSVIKYF